MAQIDFNGGAGADLLDATGVGAADFAVLRGGAGNDTLIGSSSGDRLTGDSGADSVFGGAGNDSIWLNYSAAQIERDSIDGGVGNDIIVCDFYGVPLTAALKLELVRLTNYVTTGDFSSHFISDILHLDLTDVDRVILRVNGLATTVSNVVAGPVAAADSYAGTQDQALTVLAAQGVLANDSGEAGGLKAQAGVIATALGGSVTLGADGGFSYTPAAGVSGADSFSYTLVDALGRTTTGTASIALAGPSNTAPTLANPLADTGGTLGSSLSYTVAANAFQDAEGGSLTYSATLSDGSALPGWLSFDAASRTFTGTVPTSLAGAPLDIKVTVTDSGGLSANDVFRIKAIGTLTPTPAPDFLDYSDSTSDFIYLPGSAGNDTILAPTVGVAGGIVSIEGGAGDDSLVGGGGPDSFDGKDGNDTILGAGGNDFMLGAAGNDLLDGGAGNDTIQLGAGPDTISGGTGADRFMIWTGASQTATIMDFEDGVDYFWTGASASGLSGMASLTVDLFNGNVRISWSNSSTSGTIILDGVTNTSLITAADFQFL